MVYGRQSANSVLQNTVLCFYLTPCEKEHLVEIIMFSWNFWHTEFGLVELLRRDPMWSEHNKIII